MERLSNHHYILVIALFAMFIPQNIVKGQSFKAKGKSISVSYIQQPERPDQALNNSYQVGPIIYKGESWMKNGSDPLQYFNGGVEARQVYGSGAIIAEITHNGMSFNKVEKKIPTKTKDGKPYDLYDYEVSYSCTYTLTIRSAKTNAVLLSKTYGTNDSKEQPELYHSCPANKNKSKLIECWNENKDEYLARAEQKELDKVLEVIKDELKRYFPRKETRGYNVYVSKKSKFPAAEAFDKGYVGMKSGLTKFSNKNIESGKEEINEAIVIYQSIVDKYKKSNPPAASAALCNIAMAQAWLKDDALAESSFEQAKKLYDKGKMIKYTQNALIRILKTMALIEAGANKDAIVTNDQDTENYKQKPLPKTNSDLTINDVYPTYSLSGGKYYAKSNFITIKFTVTSPKTFSKIKVIPEGSQMVVAKNINDNTYEAEIDISLSENKITIQAYDKHDPVFAYKDLMVIWDDNPQDIKNYALLVGVSDYSKSNLGNLKSPQSDVQRIKELLDKNYNFEQVEIINPRNRKEFDDKLRQMIQIVGDHPKRQLLIYMTGHGTRDYDYDMGYFIPGEVNDDNYSDCISYSEIRTKLRVSAQHILIMIDACFSGSFFAGTKSGNFDGELRECFTETELTKGMNAKSRLAVTSTDSSTSIADSYINTEHSPFAIPFINLLETGKAFKFSKLKSAIENSESSVNYSPIANDFEGHNINSSFYFIPKGKLICE